MRKLDEANEVVAHTSVKTCIKLWRDTYLGHQIHEPAEPSVHNLAVSAVADFATINHHRHGQDRYDTAHAPRRNECSEHQYNMISHVLDSPSTFVVLNPCRVDCAKASVFCITARLNRAAGAIPTLESDSVHIIMSSEHLRRSRAKEFFGALIAVATRAHLVGPDSTCVAHTAA